MPTLSNPRHEKFAKGLADGLKQKDAYIAAGYEGNESAASQIAARPEVVGRVQELIEERQAAIRSVSRDEDDSISDLDKEWIMRMLKTNVQQSQNAGQFSAANKSIELIMDMLGLTKKSKTVAPVDEDKKAEASQPSNDKLASVLDSLSALKVPTIETTDASPAA